VLVEGEERAEPGVGERGAGAREPIIVQPAKSIRSSKSTCVWPGACSGRSQRWCGSMSSGRMIFGSFLFCLAIVPALPRPSALGRRFLEIG
jgi:hypothetical protein